MLECGWSGLRLHEPFEGLIQEFEEQIGFHRRTQLSYYIFDSHYYLADWQPIYQGQTYLVGGLFHPLPGVYALPCGEGQFMISEKDGIGHVTMFTKSAGIGYDHPLVGVANCDTRFDYGWYSHVKCVCDSTDLAITTI